MVPLAKSLDTVLGVKNRICLDPYLLTQAAVASSRAPCETMLNNQEKIMAKKPGSQAPKGTKMTTATKPTYSKGTKGMTKKTLID